MNRRTFLSSISSITLTSYITQTQTQTENESETSTESKCIVRGHTYSALSEPDSDPDFTVSGKKDVNVYWMPESYFDDKGHHFARAIADLNGSIITLNKKYIEEIDDYVLLHELAHSLGYQHGDGGIVNSDVALYENTGDRDQSQTELAESTTDVGNSFDAYDIYTAWDVVTLGVLGTEFAQDNMLVTELGTAGQRFASSRSIEDMLIKNSHNGFGGQFDSGLQADSTNVYAGQFYKSH